MPLTFSVNDTQTRARARAGGHDGDPLVVVGSGIAGALLALRAAATMPVVLVTAGALESGSTRAAQGGMAAAVGRHDSVAAHLADTLAAGAGLCDAGAAARICAEGPAQVSALIAYGVAFDRRRGRLELAREGAHGHARVVHAGGDATGAHISAALAAALRAHPAIELATGETAEELELRDGRVVGLRTRAGDGSARRHGARAVALATGGMGQLFGRTTNPAEATGAGVALAAWAGAAVADLEMMQFHPTALALGPSPLPLVSEAVRGEGAYLRDARGRRFMRDAHPLAELGPRDVVARAIARRAAEDGAEVTLDLRHLEAAEVRRRFPTVAAACAAHGLDLATDPIPVTPAAHYAIGGVLADMAGRTTLPGLLAVGECAATGAHGANRLASNSLLEGAVMAGLAAAALAAGDDAPLAGPRGSATTPPTPCGADGAAVRGAVGRILWAGAGVERDAGGLAEAARALAALPQGSGTTSDAMLALARLTVLAAAHRTESRGAHFRRDHPTSDPAQAARVAWAGGAPLTIAPTAPARTTRAEEAA